MDAENVKFSVFLLVGPQEGQPALSHQNSHPFWGRFCGYDGVPLRIGNGARGQKLKCWGYQMVEKKFNTGLAI